MNPETDLVITKNDEILKDCKACGAIKPVDLRHKLSTYILKNPPPKPSKKIKKSGDSTPAQETSKTPEDGASDSETDHDALTRKIQQDAAKLPRQSQLDDGWAEDTTPEAVAARMKELQVSNALDTILNGAEDDLQDPLEEFASFALGTPTPSAQQILDKADDLDIPLHRAAAVLPQILLKDVGPGMFKPHLAIYKMFTKNAKQQIGFLGGIERFIGHIKPELLPKIAVILKFIYDEELVDEETFSAWEEKVSKRYVDRKVSRTIREKAKPFLDWLKNAEEESEEESDDE